MFRRRGDIEAPVPGAERILAEVWSKRVVAVTPAASSAEPIQNTDANNGASHQLKAATLERRLFWPLVGPTNAQTVQYIEPQCFDVTRGPSQTEPRATSYNGIRGKDSDAFCGSYETYAYAIVGTYTKSGSTPGINSIGLKCRTLDAANGDDNGND